MCPPCPSVDKTTRPAGTGSDTGHCRAGVSDREVFFFCDIIGRKKKNDKLIWQSENHRDSGHASIAGGSPEPSKAGSSERLPHCRHGENPVNPLASLAEEDDNKVCLPAKRQPISILRTGTGNAPFSTLQVKVSGSLHRKHPQRTAKPTAFYALSATHKKGVVKPRLLKIRGRKSKI